jgi:hypothetical protein
MRKLAIILAIVLSVVVIVAVLLVVGIRRMLVEQTDAQAYVDRVLPAAFAEWDSDLFFEETTPEFKNVTSSEKLDSLFEICADRLGKMKRYRGAQGNTTVWFPRRPDGETARGFYTAVVDFEKDVARVQVEVVKRDDAWKIVYFFVNSNALLIQPGAEGETPSPAATEDS